MLSSITPLGQRARGASWIRTVSAFWIGSLLAGALVFGSIGLVGEFVRVDELYPWWGLAAVTIAAVLDAFAVQPLGPRRQVDDDWLGRYRDWVVGFGFGSQLGAGFTTIVPSFGSWAILLTAMSAGWRGGMIVGMAFGLGRSLLLVMTRNVRTPGALAASMKRFALAEGRARRVSLLGYASVVLIAGLYVT